MKEKSKKKRKDFHVAEKVRNLVTAIGKDSFVYFIEPYQSIAVVNFFTLRRDCLAIIYEEKPTEDFNDEVYLYSKDIVSQFRHRLTRDTPESVRSFSPVEFLAMLVTGGIYIGFHDKMTWLDNEFKSWWSGGPNYRKIKRVLHEAGFTGIEKVDID